MTSIRSQGNSLNNKLKKQFAVAVLAGLPLFAAGIGMASMVYAAPTSSAETAATNNLNQYLSRISSLQASFSQTTQVAAPKGGKAPGLANQGLRNSHLNQTFSGVMQVKRPGLFRWETTSPSKQLIVTTGKTVWIYDPDLEQAVRQNLDDQVGNTPALLLSGQSATIMKSFRVTQPNAKEAYFVLYPKQEDGAFESLGIRFSNNSPSQMILKDSLGQQTTINFSNVQSNPNLSTEAFNFVPPKGVDVIDQ